MRGVVRWSVLLSACICVLPALSEPARAHYLPPAVKGSREGRPEPTLERFVAENARLSRELEAVRERCRKTREETEELTLKLLCLRNAASLRSKLAAMTGAARQQAQDVPQCNQPAGRFLSGLVNSRPVRYLRRFVAQVANRWIAPSQLTAREQACGEGIEPETGRFSTVNPEVDVIRKRIEGLKERLERAKSVKEDGLATPEPEQIAPAWILEKLKKDVLQELTRDFRDWLEDAVKGLERQKPGGVHEVRRPSAWF